MTLERLNELKNTIYADYAGDDMFDLLLLIDAEIRRIESRRKVPLMPCRCGAKRISSYRKFYQEQHPKQIGYVCMRCGAWSELADTDREARIAWNEAQKGGKG